MSQRDITTIDSEGNRHRRPGGVYIPRAKEKKRMERLMERRASGRAKSASAHALRSGYASVRHDNDDEVGSHIGRMKVRDNGTQTHVMSAFEDRELSEEERHKIWQPPVRDISRFKGTSASRHRAGSTYKGPSDHPGGSFAAVDELPPARKKKAAGGSTAGKKPTAAKAAKGTATVSPLSPKEIRKLDKSYRLYGANPEWSGWDSLLTGRTREFLLSEAKRLRLDKPDDSTWTRGERAVFDEYWEELKPSSQQWKMLLPRKSSAAIARQYRWVER